MVVGLCHLMRETVTGSQRNRHQTCFTQSGGSCFSEGILSVHHRILVQRICLGATSHVTRFAPITATHVMMTKRLYLSPPLAVAVPMVGAAVFNAEVPCETVLGNWVA